MSQAQLVERPTIDSDTIPFGLKKLVLGKQEAISAANPDWTREQPGRWWEPGPRLLRSIRGYQKWKGRAGLFGLFLSKFYVLRHRFWSVVSGAEIPLNCHIAGGLLLPHPNGIVIHPDAVVGPN